MKFVKFIFALCLLLIIAATAQATTIGEFEVTPRVFLLEGYDDNITSVDDNKRHDFFNDLALSVDVKHESKLQQFSLTGNVTQQLFYHESKFNNTSETVNANYRRDLSKYDSISLNDAFTHAEEPTSFEDAFGRTSGRYGFYLNRFDTSYQRSLSKELSLEGHYGNENYNVSRSDQQDSLEHHAGATVSYYVSSASIFSLLYNYSNRNFDPGTDATTNTFLAGLKHYFTSQLYAEGKAGADCIDSYTNRNYTKPHFMLSLIDEVDPKTKAGITYTNDYSTNAYTEDIFNSWRVSINLGKQLLQRLNAYSSVFYGEGRYPTLQIKDTLQGITLGTNYELSRNTTATLSYSFSQAESNVDTRDYAKNLTMLSLNVKF